MLQASDFKPTFSFKKNSVKGEHNSANQGVKCPRSYSVPDVLSDHATDLNFDTGVELAIDTRTINAFLIELQREAGHSSCRHRIVARSAATTLKASPS